MRNNIIRLVIIPLTVLLALTLSYNLASIFTNNINLQHDEAEHLHVAYLLDNNQIPYKDFIENHPMLFNHFIREVNKIFHFSYGQRLISFTRVIIFIHFLLLALIIQLWFVGHFKKIPTWSLWITAIIAWTIPDWQHPALRYLWQIRPDFIAYSYTVLGAFLISSAIVKNSSKQWFLGFTKICIGAFMIGLGNAVLPKGLPILTAIFLAFTTNKLINQDNFLKDWDFIKKILTAIILSTCFFIIFVWLDSSLSGVSARQWINAVFTLNAKKHLIISNINNGNPLSILINISSLSLLMLAVLISWMIWEFTQPHHSIFQHNIIKVLTYANSILLINIVTPSYSNGAVFPHALIPSLFCLLIIYQIALLRLYNLWAHNITTPRNTKLLLTTIAVSLIAAPLFYQPLQAIVNYKESKQIDKEKKFSIHPKDYPQNHITYLARTIKRVPITVDNWGYYYMLADNIHFWKDCFQLHLGPDPQQDWNRFKKTPADVLAFNDIYELVDFVNQVWQAQNINIDWLITALIQDYEPLINHGHTIFVRRGKEAAFLNMGWRSKLTSSPNRPFNELLRQKKGSPNEQI